MSDQYIIHAKNYDKWARIDVAKAAFEHFKIPYTIHNDGVHWKFIHNNIEYNYFPTTGKWYTIKPKHSCLDHERYLGGLLRTLGFKFKEI